MQDALLCVLVAELCGSGWCNNHCEDFIALYCMILEYELDAYVNDLVNYYRLHSSLSVLSQQTIHVFVYAMSGLHVS